MPLEIESGLALQTEDLKYGLRVVVLALPADKALLSEAALKVVGPRAFKYNVDVKY